MGKINCTRLILVFTICMAVQCHAMEEATTTGVASPRNADEKNKVEILRERALRNAMDLAIMQVMGVTVSGERGSSYRTRENITASGAPENPGNAADRSALVKEESEAQSRYSSGAVTKTEGHAKLQEIIKEWQDEGQYYITAKFSVETEEEAVTARDAGYYWEMAGRPDIGLSYSENHNGEQVTSANHTTLRFIRDNLVRNNLEVSDSGTPAYRIAVQQVLESSTLADFGTTTMNCRLSFRIIDQLNGATLEEYRKSHGPEAGFTAEMAAEKCVAALAPDIAENLVRKFAAIMNDQVQNGREYHLLIDGLPGDVVTKISEISQNLYRITSFTPTEYINQNFSRTIFFKGSGTELAQSLTEAFGQEDWSVTIVGVGNGTVHLKWMGKQ